MVLLEIPRSEYTPVNIVLTGGTANLPGMEEFAQQVVGLPARVERPKGLPQNASNLDDPAYASSIGLLLWGARQQEEVEQQRMVLAGGLERFTSGFLSTMRTMWSRRPRIKFET